MSCSKTVFPTHPPAPRRVLIREQNASLQRGASKWKQVVSKGFLMTKAELPSWVIVTLRPSGSEPPQPGLEKKKTVLGHQTRRSGVYGSCLAQSRCGTVLSQCGICAMVMLTHPKRSMKALRSGLYEHLGNAWLPTFPGDSWSTCF